MYVNKSYLLNTSISLTIVISLINWCKSFFSLFLLQHNHDVQFIIIIIIIIITITIITIQLKRSCEIDLLIKHMHRTHKVFKRWCICNRTRHRSYNIIDILKLNHLLCMENMYINFIDFYFKICMYYLFCRIGIYFNYIYVYTSSFEYFRELVYITIIYVFPCYIVLRNCHSFLICLSLSLSMYVNLKQKEV